VSRICTEVRAQLPAYVAGSLPRWRRRAVDLHLRRCEPCRAELDAERAVSAGLASLGAASEEGQPPTWLLDELLDQVDTPGLRGRAAVPARGAVSGARPVLSVVLLIVGAAAGTAAGWATVRGTRAVRHRVSGRGRSGRPR
jgi:anti-sigma factor RsiW